AVDSLIHKTYVSHADGQVTGVKPAIQLKPSPRPTGQQQFPWPSTAGQSNPK
ncbi:unnamed protein product, partial [Porites lobata]